VLLFTDDSWEIFRDSNNHRLTIGLFQFHKKAVSAYTEVNNSCDVLAAFHLMVLLQLEDFSVCDNLSHICDSHMKFFKILSNGQLTNHNSFGQVNKKFAWFVIDFISVQLVFNNWYSFLTQFAPSPFAKNIPEEIKQVLKKNQMIFINI
jgi:hypothetical protein